MAWTDITRTEHSRTYARYPSDLSDAEWAVVAPFIYGTATGCDRRCSGPCVLARTEVCFLPSEGNRIVDRLQGRMTALGLSVVIEQHMSGGNRCDITASAIIEGANRLLVIEVKGQWNKELYSAAATQLDQRYAIHPDAAKQGVYLALWYGNGEKVARRSDTTITTATELKDKMISGMSEELRRRIDVVVLDLSRLPPVARRVRLH